ncbi:MAG: hypothetical protein IT286_02325, partial [Proteobacteria bacterium]|nr:hypothetical protein [Pseudomonadota bacterium]
MKKTFAAMTVAGALSGCEAFLDLPPEPSSPDCAVEKFQDGYVETCIRPSLLDQQGMETSIARGSEIPLSLFESTTFQVEVCLTGKDGASVPNREGKVYFENGFAKIGSPFKAPIAGEGCVKVKLTPESSF